MKKNILVVAQDAAFRAALARRLMSAGYGIELAESAKRARDVVAGERRLDLGIMATDGSGVVDEHLARDLSRATGGLLIVAPASYRAGQPPADADVITSTDAGEILARVEERLRRELPQEAGRSLAETLSFAEVTIDVAGHSALDAAGREIALTRAEFALLIALARAPGRALSRDQLRVAVTGDDGEQYDRSIDVMVWRLRRKVEADPKQPRIIQTVPGIGYKFAAARQAGPAPSAMLAAAAAAPAEIRGASVDDRPSLGRGPTERRQVTVLACGFVGWAALSARLDPEELDAVMTRCRQTCSAIVAAHEGRTARHLGDGLVAHFGDPQSHENDAERAVRAGLALLDAARAEDGSDPALAFRIGIASGLVLVGQGVGGGDASERVAVGEAAHLAERLARSAEPGALMLAPSTHRLVRGWFECRERGAVVLEGYPEDVPIWQVMRARTIDSRFEAQRGIDLDPSGMATLAAEGLTPFVGRGHELDMLMRSRDQAATRLTVVDIVGDAGIGKSRLLHEFRAQLVGDGAFVLLGSCWPDSQQTPFRPFIDVVRRSFRISSEDSDSDAAMKFATALEFLGLPGAESVGLLMNLMGRAPPPGSLSGLDGVLIGLRTRDLLLGLLRERSRMAPLALMIEDLHWIDRASADLVAQLVAATDAPPMLVLNTFRPAYRAPWAGRDNAVRLALAPLSAPDTASIVESRLGAIDRPTALIRTIVERAEGNPLFAEEITNFLVERTRCQIDGTAPVAGATDFANAMPASLQTLLTARVDRLTQTGRTLLQAASVIGRSFQPELLDTVTDARTEVMPQLLAMAELDLIHRDERSSAFVFKHALVRDALYQSLPSGARKALHLRIAQEIERRSAGRIDEHVETLAHHYAQTDDREKAIRYLALAGKKGLGIYSLDEAEHFLRSAIALSRATDERAMTPQIADIMVDLATALYLAFKPGETIALIEPFLPELDRLGDAQDVALLLDFYALSLFTHCRWRDARLIEAKALAMAERLGDPHALAATRSGTIMVSNFIDPLPLDEFERLAQSAFAVAEQVGDAFVMGRILMATAWNYLHRGLVLEGSQWAQRLMALGRDRRDPRFRGTAMWLLGWLDFVAEDYASALRQGEECARNAITPFDRQVGLQIFGASLLLLGRLREGTDAINAHRSRALAQGWHYTALATELPMAASLLLCGSFKAGVRALEGLISRCEVDYGYQGFADFGRIYLAEFYIALSQKTDRRPPPLSVVLKNLWFLVRAKPMAARRAHALLEVARRNPIFDAGGVHSARIAYDLGLIYKSTGRAALAREQFERARAAAAAQKAEALRTKIDAAIASL